MKAEEKFICDFVYDFVDKNWSKINKERCELVEQTKKSFLKETKTNLQTAIWVITEVANWWMDKKYLREIYMDVDDEYEFRVWKIKDKYIKLIFNTKIHSYSVKFTTPKTKTVIYFE